MNIFTQDAPASRFGEAYPVGNGQMGAVVYGSFPVEKIVLTENTFFSGKRSAHNNQPGAKEAFYRMRELLSQGKYEEAHQEAKNFHGIRGDYGTNLPVGNLEIGFLEETSPARYKRSLDISQGTAQVDFFLGENHVHTCTFASHPDHVLVWNMKAQESCSLWIKFSPYHDNGQMVPDENGFLYTAKARETIHCNTPCGVTLYGRCMVRTDGKTKTENGKLYVSNAGEVSLYLLCDTDYPYLMRRGSEESGSEKAEASPEFLCDDKMTAEEIWKGIEKRRKELEKKSYDEILSSHKQDVSRVMDRVEFHLEGEENQTAAQMFQYGRYLLFSSSREDSLLPAHLQGIWNDDVACRIGWSCDMHLDINTQMNYWIAGPAQLPESILPLAGYTGLLAREGEQTARQSYGLKGWAAELVSNAWGYAAPYWAVPLSPYPTGGLWLLSNLWQYCEFTEDRKLLTETVYPLMKGAVRFFAGYVWKEEGTGNINCGPSVSAENTFLVEGRPCQISNGCTYEMTVIHELFQEFLKVSDMLKEMGSSLYEPSLADRAGELLAGMGDFSLCEDGTLAEWSHDYKAADPQHRHTSHLMGLYPYAQITPEDTPALARAAEKSIEAKLTPYENWEDTGWARSLLILYEARLHHGEKAGFHVKSMVENLREPNGMIYHPPTRGTVFDDDFGHVYELDGNTGLSAGICEMLLQSHGGVLNILPAIPGEWHTGYVKGLLARGNIKVSIWWEKGYVTKLSLFPEKDQRCLIKVNGEKKEIFLTHHQEYCVNFAAAL